MPVLIQTNRNDRRNDMRRIRLSLRNLSITDKIAKGRHIVGSLTNNASFQTPSPPLAEVTSALEELDKAQAAVQAAKSEVATSVLAQDGAETRVNQILTQLAGYVESVAGTDDSLITSIGMGLCLKSRKSACKAPTARNMIARGKREARRPWLRGIN